MFPNDPFITDFHFAKNSNRSDVSRGAGGGAKSAGNITSSESTLDLIFIRGRKKSAKYLAFWQTAKLQQTSAAFLFLSPRHADSLPHKYAYIYHFSTCLGPSWGIPACIAMGDWQHVSTRGEGRPRLSELTLDESLKPLSTCTLAERQRFLAVTPSPPPTYMIRYSVCLTRTYMRCWVMTC